MDLAINNGLVIDPRNRIEAKWNIGIKDGKICVLSQNKIEAKKEIEAQGLVVAPGFIDAHMHEGAYNRDTDTFEQDIFECMLRMGVTTAVGGNCGSGPEDPEAYMAAVDRLGLPVNLALFVPHDALRKRVGENDKYRSASKENIARMKTLAAYYLDKGCAGISFGIRYVPGINREELITLCEAAQKDKKIIAAHIRNDGGNVFSSLMELVDVAQALDVPIQISHIGSMGGYGQMAELLEQIEAYKAKGLDIGIDCYPYNAFSTGIGETTYDPGFLEHYRTQYASIEIAEGPYRGQRCTAALFQKLRKEAPGTITIGHVMKESDIDRALAHPEVLIGSDGYLHQYQGHPRAAGTFPRVISRYVRDKKLLTLYQAIEKMTYLTAKRFGLKKKGSLGVTSDADIVIFDAEKISDKATFEQPVLPPEGIRYVLLGGELALEDKGIVRANLGKTIRK